MTFRTPLRLWFLALTVLLLGAGPAAAQETAAGEDLRLTLEDIHASPKFYPEPFQGGRWAESGPVVTYIERDDGLTHLIRYNFETDERTRLIDGTDLYAEDVERPIGIEYYAYSPDGERVLLYTDSERVWRLNTKGFYYIYDIRSETLTPLSDRSKGHQMFAKFSPDGRRVAFVRDRNLFVVDLETKEETQLTSDGEEGGIINGTTDWVYEEEFGLRDGFSWSPDGRHLAFIQMDETGTRAFHMADLREQYPEFYVFRYPKAGEDNSEIHVGVIDVESGAKRFFDTGTWYAGGDSLEYIPKMGWTPALGGTHYVWMFRLDRDQNDLDLLYGDPETGALRTVLEEHEETWIDVKTGFSDLDIGKLTYLDDGEHFIWNSEAEGHRHLYLYRNDGTFVRQITDGPWDVTDFHGVDEARGVVYFTATIEGPLERHLYRLPLEGGAEPIRITEAPGWHQVDLSRDFRYYIDIFSDAVTPPVISLHRSDGTLLEVLEGNEDLRETLAAYDLPAPEFIEVQGADGTPLNAMIIKPKDFDPNRVYPLLMYTYGGPGSQHVRNAWYSWHRRLWHHLLAENHGVLVAVVDNRGTGGRGKAFKSGVYKRLGQLEAEDQITAAQHFGSLPYVDRERIGIWGWSYGGYLTLMSMLYGAGPQTFKAGIAVAPVTDWRLYDTIYTERYMSTPQRNPLGYRAGAPISYADRLSDDQRLLIVHGDYDDNVHYQNAVQMADALQAAGKQFEMMVYPGRDHGITGGRTRLHLYQMMTDFIKENLLEADGGA